MVVYTPSKVAFLLFKEIAPQNPSNKYMTKPLGLGRIYGTFPPNEEVFLSSPRKCLMQSKRMMFPLWIPACAGERE